MSEKPYSIAADGRSILCHRCGRRSHNLHDVAHRYCGFCHRFHEDDDERRDAMIKSTRPPLTETYWELVRRSITSEGITPSPLLAVSDSDEVTMVALAIPNQMIMDIVHRKFIADLTIKEIIFGVDRFTKPGQGTKYDDVFTVYWWRRSYNCDHGFQFGLIEYRYNEASTIVEPLDWDNEYWTRMMRKEIETYNDHMNQSTSALLDKLVDDVDDATH